MPRPAFVLLFLGFIAFFLGLGRPAVTDADEAFYARAAWEMVERGDWLTPHFNDEYRWQKPVLYYWLTAALYRVTGATEWSARFWSAFSALGLVFLTWSIAGHLTRRSDVALLAGAIVATSFGPFALGRMSLPDMPLAFLVTFGIWAVLRAVDRAGPAREAPAVPPATRGATGVPAPAHRSAAAVAIAPAPVRARTRVGASVMRWWMLAGAAAGAGFLMKGPVALVLPALVLLPIWWRERRTIVIDWRGPVAAAAVAALIGLPWYVAMWSAHGSAYLHSFFLGDNLERFATERFNERRGPFYYVPVLVGGLLPWSIFLLVLPWRPLLARLRGTVRMVTAEWRLLIWAAMPLLFYTASLGKQPRYILPVLPPVAILLAGALAARVAEAGTGTRPRALRVATWGTAALFVACGLVLARMQPLFVEAYSWATWMGVGALLALGVAIASIATGRAWPRLPGTVALAAALLLVTMQFGALAGIRPAAVERMAALVEAHREAAEPVGVYEVFVRNLVFYTNIRQWVIFSDEVALQFLHSDERVLLVVRAPDLARLESRAAVPLRRLGSVRYVDTAGFRLGTLLRPDPARTVQEVVLVTNR